MLRALNRISCQPSFQKITAARFRSAARVSRPAIQARMASSAAPTAVVDHTTQSNYIDVSVKHSHFELDVNLKKQVIEGYALLHIAAHNDGVKQLLLDTRDLTIQSVESDGNKLQFEVGERHQALGSLLMVQLHAPLKADGTAVVGIRFSTSPTSTAVQYLDPQQTAGGVYPYMFTQCQAIHARSLVPCQDTPAVKSSYSAAVRVPAPLTALMSAVPSDSPPPLGDSGESAAAGVPHLADVKPEGDTKIFYYSQKVPIPSYLIALAVGQLESRELSSRSRVWSEPSMVEAGAFEFAETAKFLDAAEEIAGPYVWGRYDLLLLPPSFPYGGMENPCLTFVTPTLLAGDRSLTNVVAHEIAHSWTGNLVTNASWEHFWLNEGWTVFLERKILGRVYGEASLQFHAGCGALSLEEEVKRLGPSANFTRLVPSLEGGQDPDDAFSRIPYEKGFYFLYYLQQLLGGSAAFEPFMRHYLQHFAFKTVTTDQFKAYFLQSFADKPEVSQIDWDAWLYSPGMPPVRNQYDTGLATAAQALAVKWHTADVMGLGGVLPEGVSSEDMKGWSSEQVVSFLDQLALLRSLTPLHSSTTRALAELYGLDKAKNCEIRAAWYKLAIPAEDAAVLPGVLDLLSSQGRMKYLRPLYRALYRSKMGRQPALDTFAACKAKYHPIAAKMVAVDLQG